MGKAASGNLGRKKEVFREQGKLVVTPRRTLGSIISGESDLGRKGRERGDVQRMGSRKRKMTQSLSEEYRLRQNPPGT